VKAIVSTQPAAIAPIEGTPFDAIRELALQTVAASSARIYAQTYALWGDYCHDHRLDPLDLRPATVIAFLASKDTTKTTRQRQLSALRKLVEKTGDYFAFGGDRGTADKFRALGNILRDTRPPVGTGGKERARRALIPAEADKLFRVWHDDTRLHKRNHALICLLALSGIRRSEAAALRWRDVDFANGVITIRHGKGDKAREVPLAGDLALEALKAWQMAQDAGREWVFCPVRKGDKLGIDKPITGQAVLDVVDLTHNTSGIEFKPHDLRRTFITEALATGTPLATVQAAAGHARGETTLGYAQAVNARQARKELKLRYG
jgi:integrase